LIALLALSVAVAAPVVRAASFKIVVHPDSPLQSLSHDELSGIFLKTQLELQGRRVTPVDQSASSEVRRTFTSIVHNQSIEAMMSYWQKQIFAGRAAPPVVKEGDAAVLDYVRSDPSAIGYVEGSSEVEGVRVVALR
jgi:ABC-type phosphate transport system substrate-binding protein